jgi:SWI/SNF-related matrix-associated actin-dependent regulator 1 of chromatin subfamily A
MELAGGLAKALREDSPDVRLNQIPSNTTNLLMMQMPMNLEVREGRKNVLKTIQYNKNDLLMDPKSLPFYDLLYSFQREAVVFGVKHFGRVLIADEMGIGKTVESLAVAHMYREEWPLLIICPSSLKYTWREQVLRWFRSVK